MRQEDKVLLNTMSRGVSLWGERGPVKLARKPKGAPMSSPIGKKLAEAMKKAGIIPAEMARRLGVTPQAVSNWVKTGRISKPNLARFAKETKTTTDALLGGKNNVAPLTGIAYRRVPLISWVQAGGKHPVVDPYQQGSAEDWEDATVDMSDVAFALRVRGDSMEPDFPEGSVIFVDPAAECRNGDFVVVRFNFSDEATFKRLVIDGPLKFLQALNPNYPNIPLGKDAHIVGKVVELTVRRRFK